MPVLALSTKITPPDAGDVYTYTTVSTGPHIWTANDVDVVLTRIVGADSRVLTTDSSGSDLYDLPTGADVEFTVTPNKAGGDPWFILEV